LHVRVFGGSDLPARQTFSARVAFDRPFAVNSLRKGEPELMFPDASRSCQNQALPDSTFGDGSLEEPRYSFVSDKG
jgi:hypothetical protein